MIVLTYKDIPTSEKVDIFDTIEQVVAHAIVHLPIFPDEYNDLFGVLNEDKFRDLIGDYGWYLDKQSRFSVSDN